MWLQRLGKKCWYTLAPTIFVSCVTQVNGVVAQVMMLLATHLLYLAQRGTTRRAR